VYSRCEGNLTVSFCEPEGHEESRFVHKSVAETEILRYAQNDNNACWHDSKVRWHDTYLFDPDMS